MYSQDNDGFQTVTRSRRGRQSAQQNNRPASNQQPAQLNRAQRRAAVQSQNSSTSSRPGQSGQNGTSSRAQHVPQLSSPAPAGPISSWRQGTSSLNDAQLNVPHQARQTTSAPSNVLPSLLNVSDDPRTMVNPSSSQNNPRPRPSSAESTSTVKPSPSTNNINRPSLCVDSETGSIKPNDNQTASQAQASCTQTRAPPLRPDHKHSNSAPMTSQAHSFRDKETKWPRGPKGGGSDGWEHLKQQQLKQDKANEEAYYRQTLPGKDNFRYMRVVHWKPIPEAVEKHLNSHRTKSLLKQLQVDQRCFIWYTATVEVGSKLLSGLAIVGNHQEQIDIVTNQLKGFPNWLQAEQLSDPTNRCSTFWLVKETSPSNANKKICSTKYESPERSRRLAAKSESKLLFTEENGKGKGKGKGKVTDLDEIVEKKVSSLTELAEGETIIGGQSATHVNALYLEAFLMRLLRQLQYRKGSPELRVQVGTCVMMAPPKATKDEGCSVGVFKDRLCEVNSQEYNMKGRLTTELGDLLYEGKVLSNFANSSIFEQVSDVQYGATFIMEHQLLVDEALQLDVSFGYLRERPRWSIVDRRTLEPKKLLKVHLLDLQHTALSYGIDLALRDSLDPDIDAKSFERYVTHRYRKFAEDLTLQPDHEASFERDRDGDCCIRMPTELNSTRPTVPLHRFTQYRRKTYKIVDRGYDPYHVEVTEFRVFESADAESKTSKAKTEAASPELRVQVSVSHPDWQYWFAQNERLLPGQCGWKAKERLFFPCKPADNAPEGADATCVRGDGLKELLHVLALVDDTIKA